MRLNHKNKDILSQTKLFFELIAELLTRKKLKYHLKWPFFDQTVIDLNSYKSFTKRLFK